MFSLCNMFCVETSICYFFIRFLDGFSFKCLCGTKEWRYEWKRLKSLCCISNATKNQSLYSLYVAEDVVKLYLENTGGNFVKTWSTKDGKVNNFEQDISCSPTGTINACEINSRVACMTHKLPNEEGYTKTGEEIQCIWREMCCGYQCLARSLSNFT